MHTLVPIVNLFHIRNRSLHRKPEKNILESLYIDLQLYEHYIIYIPAYNIYIRFMKIMYKNEDIFSNFIF